ncbi:MAG: LptE family protein [Candidatus Competibacteraceae bacterium]|nr:LptE family protein [Candidatus Competibacteraceae bacterium]
MRQSVKCLFFITSAIILLIGCKVNYSLSGASIPDNVKTVSIEYFENQAGLTNPNFPQIITEALRDKFISQTRLKLVNTDGDVHFRGVITGYQSTPVALTGNDQASLNRLTISVGIIYENKYDDSQNFTQSFSRFADFSASQNLSAVEDALMNEISGQLVQDIFNRAFLNW